MFSSRSSKIMDLALQQTKGKSINEYCFDEHYKYYNEPIMNTNLDSTVAFKMGKFFESTENGSKETDSLTYTDLVPLSTETETRADEVFTEIGKNTEEPLAPAAVFSPSKSTTIISETTIEDSGSSYRPDDDKEANISSFSDRSMSSGKRFAKKISVSGSVESLCVNEDDAVKNTTECDVQKSSKNFKKHFNFSGTVDKSKKKAITNKRVWDKKDMCIFCEEAVTNFTRHLSRKHSEELEVAKYLSLKKGSLERKNLADQLRKRGNFFYNVSGVPSIKPVRRPYQCAATSLAKDYLPCKYCYGHLKKQYLRRHVKICKLKKGELGGKRRNVQAEAQSLLLTFTSEDTKLVEEVFPRMAPDDVSAVVKGDPLIRAFGTRYIKCHKERHLITVASNKMRELARLLIEMRKIESNCQTLLDCLKPKHFDSIIKSAKIIAGYDLKTDKFQAPSLVLKISTSLKQCCDIAEYLLLKESPLLRRSDNLENTIQTIKTVEKLIEKQWSYELSTNASKEIYQNKWNKPAFLPLTSDIKILRDHLISVQKKSLDALKKNPEDINAFRNLQEIVLAQLILLNRKRAGEVQRIFLSTYLNASTETPQEEIELSLSPVERQLINIFKRIVIRGKRGRGVPILFTPRIQKSLSVLISLREQFCDKTNEYLFAVPNTEHSCLRASTVIRQLAIASGAKKPATLTSTKLRKQVATVAQLLNFTEGDVEQLANFMGHSKDIHKTFYRLPENVFQVAKVSKFLMMMEKGTADQYRGRSLDEIDINVDGLVSEEEENGDTDISFSDEESENPTKDKSDNVQFVQPISDVEPSEKFQRESKKRKVVTEHVKLSRKEVRNKNKQTKTKGPFEVEKKKKKFVRIPWTDEQKAITRSYFQKHILLKQAPKKAECEDFISKNKNTMKGKNWQKIKTFVYNIYKVNNN